MKRNLWSKYNLEDCKVKPRLIKWDRQSIQKPKMTQSKGFKLYIWKESSQRKEMKVPLLHYKLPSQERILRVRLKTGRPSRQYSLRSDCIDIGANQRQQKKTDRVP
jgi:hypothetical protein